MIPEYHQLIAVALGGLALGLLTGCVLGWILCRWKQEGDEQIREALERRLELLRDIQRSTTGGKTRAYSVGADGFYGYREAEPKQERGTNSHQPERPFLRRQRPDVPPPPPPAGRNSKEFRGRRPYLDTSRIRVSEQILVDRDELLVLCDRVITPIFWKEGSDAVVRARQMLEKIGQDIREENRP